MSYHTILSRHHKGFTSPCLKLITYLIPLINMCVCVSALTIQIYFIKFSTINEYNIIRIYEKKWKKPLAALSDFGNSHLSSSLCPPMEGNPNHPSCSLGKSPTTLKSFASILQNTSKSFQISSDSQLPLIPSSTHHVGPALKLRQLVVDRHSTSFRLVLVGKFSHSCPTMDQSRQAFAKLDLKGNYFLGHLNSKHISIQLEHEGDFHHLWLKGFLYLNGFPMGVFH